MKITVFGHLCIDENESEQSSYRSFGSPAMYIHLLLNNLPDNEVQIVSNYGRDFLEYSGKVNLYPTEPKYAVTMLNKNKSFADGTRKSSSSQRESNESVAIDDGVKQIIQNSDVIIVAPLLPDYKTSYLQEVFSHARKDTLKVLLPQGYFRKFDESDNQHFREFAEVGEVLDLFDYVILSDEDYPDVDRLSETWAKSYSCKVIMTRGEHGARIYGPESIVDVPTEKIEPADIVDSVGSGDIFSASFVYRLVQTQDEQEAVKFANSVAGKCLKYTAVDIIEGRLKL
jgi:sugar/nucleoside kinase (ribokinase family)